MNHLFEIKFNFKITFIKPHPKKSNIIAIATDDSQLHVLDITNKENVSNMKILRENQLLNYDITSLNWSCNSSIPVDLIVTTSFGSFELYGYENEIERFEKVPREQFFSTDHVPVLLDFDTIANKFIDKRTGKQPHLIPCGDLTKIDGSIIYTFDQLEKEIFNDDDMDESASFKSRKSGIIIPSKNHQIM